MKRFYMFCLVLLVLSAHAYSQRRRPAPTPPVITSNEEIKVSTNLIRVDVVVTDKKNRPVSNLNPGDFEIYEDGKKQKISDFSYVSSGKQRKTSRPTSDSLGLETGSGGTNLKDKIAIPTTSGSTGGGEIRRTFVIVVDNLGLSFRSVGEVKRSIRKFINEQVRRGDLVSIVTTGRSGVLPAFTSNKKQLLATVKKIKWTGQSRGGADYYDPIKLTLLEEVSEQRGQDIPGVQEEAALLEDVELERKNNLAIATMRSLQYVVGGMSNLPGRKSLILFSEGFSLTNRSNRNSSVANADDSDTGAPPSSMNQFGSGAPDAVKALIESANQASVVIYPIDPRGLQYLGGAGADDDVRKAFDRNFRPGQTENKRTNRDYEFRQTQDGLRVLAKETGGFAVLNQNNLGKGLERVIDDQSYYLLGYITDMETIDGPKQVFEKVSVRLKDPDLRVRYRTAFYSEEAKRSNFGKPQSAREKVGQALAYPFRANEIKLNLYSVTGNGPEGDFVRFMINISAKDLEFKKQSNGMRTANFDLLAITLNSKDKPVNQFAKNFSLTVNEPTYLGLLKKGVVYVLPVPLKKSGIYHFRVAIYDSETGKAGAAAKFLETPKFEKQRLWISNLTLNEIPTKKQKETLNKSSLYSNTTNRKFALPTYLSYRSVIYNAKKSGEGQTDVEVQTRLILDNRIVRETPFVKLTTADQKDPNRIDLAGAIRLDKDLAPGNYIFQLIVRDGLTKKKFQIATQWVDFELTR